MHQWYDKVNFDEKHLGVFSTVTYVEKAICDYKKLPGFKEHGDGFYVRQFVLNSDCFETENQQNYDDSHIYLLTHCYDDEEDNERGSYLGVFSSVENATKAQEMYKNIPPFSKHSQGFYISKIVLNKREWAEGFFTVYYN